MSIKHSLLVLLEECPRSAAQVRRAFEEDMDGYFSLNMGQVTQTLSRLERDGLVRIEGQIVSSNGRHADSYAITPEGSEELAAWWSQSFSKPATDRDELVIKLALAARRDNTAGISLLQLLDTQRFSTLRELRELNAATENLPATRTAERLTVERRIFDLESQLRWLDRVEALSPPTHTTTDKEV